MMFFLQAKRFQVKIISSAPFGSSFVNAKVLPKITFKPVTTISLLTYNLSINVDNERQVDNNCRCVFVATAFALVALTYKTPAIKCRDGKMDIHNKLLLL